MCKDLEYVNYNVFGIKSNDPAFQKYTGEIFDITEFGLKCDIMTGRRTDMLSDSSGRWNKDPEETLKTWLTVPGRYQLLIHPQWWNI
jgi:hypothetical protein